MYDIHVMGLECIRFEVTKRATVTAEILLRVKVSFQGKSLSMSKESKKRSKQGTVMCP